MYLLEIDQAQLKNSNYSVLLSAWLISMKICPKEIFISIWHLPFQIKVHKENIRTKRETSEAYSEPFRTSNMKLLVNLTAFRYQLLPLSKLLYTEAYSAPSQTSKMELFAKILNGFHLLTIVFIA